ncbi:MULTISPECIES: beta-glucuronidase [Terrisporobacter]|uniref:Beta-glucuronidase n=2 Tax=Terrisporobacter TaxID=1505652 RepID=A0A0B3VTP6_9FIRM|nr:MULTISPECIES: beta-glucuronidase [Terrisporobacter]KHS55994.1 beta-glucuronidase [Terrisporobacter othiniensis]MCC3669208.1 beta-glucuronidase [Terrisporobacter mayombei]MCR1822038.1 beta-glucuronidase [Terrisporobacter muris]MDU6986479.1 beta-glucuronidase [Terrisporobacter othiniensis]MDY3372967.1 beta-glucuronidase [Terrisporobacter othiniensis]
MLYPIITETRQVIDLNGIWNFKLDKGVGFDEKWQENALQDSIRMAVPSSYNDLVEDSSVRDHIGWVWYEREFIISKNMLDERLVLRFGSATHHAKVYINGKLLVEHKGGFTPFEGELNEFVTIGKNRVTVAVDNVLDESTLPVGIVQEIKLPDGSTKIKNPVNFDFFNYAGIHRPVKIYTTPRTYIKDVTVITDFENDLGKVDYEVEVSGEASVAISVIDENNNIVAKGIGAKGKVEIENVKLWEPMNAYLYNLKIDLIDENNEIIDTYEQPFGVRTVKVEDGKFLINNKPFYFKGFGKHEDSHIHGRGFDEALNVKDFNLMKWIGANSFRTAHYPYSEEIMRLADREGIVVIDETPAVGVHLNFMATMMAGAEKRDTWKEIQTFEHHKDIIRELVARDKNHPCVVMWSVANEPASDEKGAYEYFKPLVELTRELDPQKRPVTVVTYLMSTPDRCQIAELLDVLCLNRYYGWYSQGGDLEEAKMYLNAELEGWNKRCPNKPIMFTEYGADTVCGMRDTTSVMFTEEYQVEYLEANHEVVDKFPNFIGEQVWNFADFATSQGIIRVQGNKKGVFTRERKPKMAAHYLRNRWHNIPDFGYKVK